MLFFMGKRHDNIILKVNILLSKNFVVMAQALIGGRFEYFLLFFCLGQGESEVPGTGGGRLFIESPRRGGSPTRGGGGGGEGSRGCLQGFFGGELNVFFFSGPKCPPSSSLCD